MDIKSEDDVFTDVTQSKKDLIPFPSYESWMHKRCHLPLDSSFKNPHPSEIPTKTEQRVYYILSVLLKRIHAFKNDRMHVLFKIVQKFFKFYLQTFNRLKVYGKENIPKNGAIFYLNQPGIDPLILLAALPYRTGALLHWNHSWLMAMIEKYFGLITLRVNEELPLMVERMVRQILTKNKYFAIWPEGHPNLTGVVEEGFSSIIRVYSVINSRENKIPFAPVLIRGSGVYLNPSISRSAPIEIHFLKPFFIKREYLLPPNEFGKTPRELINMLMLKLAKKQNQPYLAKNPVLVQKKFRYSIKNRPHNEHQWRHFSQMVQYSKPQGEGLCNNIYNLKIPSLNQYDFFLKMEYDALKKYTKDSMVIHKSKNFRELYRELYQTSCDCETNKGRLKIDGYSLVIDENLPYDILFSHCGICGKRFTIIHDISEFYNIDREKKGRKMERTRI